MALRVGIIQSNYIPWKGYFDFINSVDTFILYDDMQYTRRDWRNRNLIKSKQGLQWLTIPVEVKGKFTQRINETLIAEGPWFEQHFKALQHTYGKAPCWLELKPLLERLYEEAGRLKLLSDVNHLFIAEICKYLGIRTPMSWSSEFELIGQKSEKLLNICLQLGATEYVSGPAAKCYLDTGIFEANGIKVSFFDYSNYREYDQVFPPFEHGVTIIDLLAHVGADAPRYMKSFEQLTAVKE